MRLRKSKPVAAGKEMGKGMGRMGQKVGKGVEMAVNTDSDRTGREEKQKEKKQ